MPWIPWTFAFADNLNHLACVHCHQVGQLSHLKECPLYRPRITDRSELERLRALRTVSR